MRWFWLALLAAGCWDDLTQHVGEPCVVDEDCAQGLVCERQDGSRSDASDADPIVDPGDVLASCGFADGTQQAGDMCAHFRDCAGYPEEPRGCDGTCFGPDTGDVF